MLHSSRAAQRAAPSPKRARDWRADAACAGEDPELFFSIGDGPVDRARVKAAKAVCAGCPVRAECRAWADERGIVYGTWAGESEDQRRDRLRGQAHTRQNAGTVAVCGHCQRGYLRQRTGQQFCCHACHHTSMVKARGRDCGTTAAARRHRKRGEPMDDACRMAETLYRAQRRATRGAAA